MRGSVKHTLHLSNMFYMLNSWLMMAARRRPQDHRVRQCSSAFAGGGTGIHGVTRPTFRIHPISFLTALPSVTGARIFPPVNPFLLGALALGIAMSGAFTAPAGSPPADSA